ncbi:DUF885 domain-containing protein [Rhizorhabdus dicambivorans]|uniref:DUF885 domain-containing protein n=1 Tax=Rhizorhabdus dicambivorans TaxID=1850238 RepID=A0A2A4FWX4_9SPHN|nr:DUF885 domain-containing protein [Rhizorhabdus dicambivorans]ATE65605.1 DUF885 domain-containing protein [Rhizorhabdus dicambivorans]PCE41948.1 DUF885 domain-containing protein [Rhizorhabdus dicambivorans]
MESQSGSALSRRRFGLMLGAATIAPALPLLAGPPPNPRRPGPCPITTPVDAATMKLMEHTPEIATYGGVAGSAGGGPLARRMDDYSPEGEEAWRAALGEAGIAIERIDCSGDPLGRLRLKIAAAVIENGTRSAAIGYGRPNPFWFSGHEPYVVNQISGPVVNTPNVMIAQQPLSSPVEVDAWIEKLDGFAGGFDGVIAKLKADRGLGCIPPRALLEKTLPVIENFLAGPPDRHPMIVALRDRMSIAGLDSRTRAAAEQRAIAALEKRARPAFGRLRGVVRDMLPEGRAEAGVWAQPDGEALYAANVRSVGDSPLPPEHIHRIGLEQVRAVTSRLHARLRQLGFSRGSLRQKLDALAADPRQRFPDSAEGREAVLAYLRKLVAGMEARQPQFLPAAMIPNQRMEIRAVPAATQDSAPGGYYDGPSLDGSRPGIYWINLRDMASVHRYTLPTLSYHEGVPGHHTQGATLLSLPQAPLLLRIASFNAYQEGWALYAERFAAELGVYAQDPAGDVGRLADELFRCIRLVVDTGIHQLRWSREQAIAYMADNSGAPMSETIAEIERYMAWPGQALGYKLGQLRLLAMRDRLKMRMGKAFDLKAFHGKVLGNGAMPMDLLESIVIPAKKR